ncbi:hypothetical protein OIDMADRAFT_42108 [Oidiodendron maius Zn]|uniref:TeaA receptor TeaR n=1 Tax=Oidiodendron maius (strain Zn) TaxID=913774 RepID=A0A0C3DDU6_OIDMZ|nr:hypothetical protein OIDMADRAFT_42108 [Oidiodendron maius Zn]
MAAVSAPHVPTALIPPSSSPGAGASWNYSVSPQTETTRSTESGYLAPARVNALNRKDSSISESGSAPDSLLDLYGQNHSGVPSMDYGERKNGDIYVDDEEDPEHSRWIHRDKLARIESQELQAAGIILPRSRAASKSSRREHSREQQQQQGSGLRSEQAQIRQRIESIPTEEEEEPENRDWDLRLPAEAAEDHADGFQDISGGVKGVSRIPVSKTSPIPIPIEHLERDTPIRRMQSDVWTAEEDMVSNPKSRGRSASVKALEDVPISTPTSAKRVASENSPPKKAAVRKGSTPTTRNPSAQRPKTRSASNKEHALQRPVTRSGDSSGSASSKRPEGDPPWINSMYKPDPRLPPDQQLLPTVAKRLQQEQWKKEGKFAGTYDTQFEPLSDELPAPEPAAEVVQTPQSGLKPVDRGSEWPLQGPKSPTLSTGRPGTAGGYSTMPKISATRQEAVPSPLIPVTVEEPADEKKGCGCCTVM